MYCVDLDRLWCVVCLQRSLNGYIHGDFGAGAICNVGDTCSVSNTFTGTGTGTVLPGANVVSGNNGVWGSGSDSFGNAASNTVSFAPAPHCQTRVIRSCVLPHPTATPHSYTCYHHTSASHVPNKHRDAIQHPTCQYTR
jgi:hypothetical protein